MRVESKSYYYNTDTCVSAALIVARTMASGVIVMATTPPSG